MEEIHAINRELIAAGARKFACGVSPAAKAKKLRKQPDGKVRVTDGPYTETKEHMGGFWILEAANMDEALAWAKKPAIACDVPGEVREPFSTPLRKKNPAKASKQPGAPAFVPRAVVASPTSRAPASATGSGNQHSLSGEGL